MSLLSAPRSNEQRLSDQADQSTQGTVGRTDRAAATTDGQGESPEQSAGGSDSAACGQRSALAAREWLRRAVLSRLDHLRFGTLTLSENGHSHLFGHARRSSGEDGLAETSMDWGHLIVRDGRFYRTVALGGGLGLAEAYLRGYWDTPDLAAVLRVLAANLEVLTPSESTLARMWNRQRGWINWLRRNTRKGSRRNIAAHYDLSNDFFRLFLDPTMTYSAGWFDSPDASMEQASIAKYDRIARKLALSPEDHVLEIGTGWGGFAVHAAEHYGCRVTTTTISQEQFHVARQRAAESSACDRIDVVLKDYRDLDGTFDKLVSIEMIEAVGDRYLPQFFRQCCQLLRPGGLMCLQAILMPGQRFAAYRRGVDFIQRYVFPGGFLPSIGRIDECVGQATDLRWIGLEDMSPHYAETLRRWSAAFEGHLEQVRRLGFDDRFIRLWRYYLAYCEAGFATRQVTVAQLQLQRPSVTAIG